MLSAILVKFLVDGAIMANCTFFGHRDCPDTIKLKLREAREHLITIHRVDMFYVGHQGQFKADGEYKT